jgi:hypothetical protein
VEKKPATKTEQAEPEPVDTDFEEWRAGIRQEIDGPYWSYPDWVLPKGDLSEVEDEDDDKAPETA